MYHALRKSVFHSSKNYCLDRYLLIALLCGVVEGFSFVHRATDQTWRPTMALPCQLLGMNCATPTEFALSWPDFCQRGGGTDIHADGWGLVSVQASVSKREWHVFYCERYFRKYYLPPSSLSVRKSHPFKFIDFCIWHLILLLLFHRLTTTDTVSDNSTIPKRRLRHLWHIFWASNQLRPGTCYRTFDTRHPVLWSWPIYILSVERCGGFNGAFATTVKYR
jgi:hypothetical protein